MASDKLVTIEQVGDIVVLTLNDPDCMNAASPKIARELLAAIRQIRLGAIKARVCLLTGAGRGFCSGAKMIKGNPLGPLDADGRPDVGSDLESLFNPLMTEIRNLPIPFVTAVNGAAAGVGCSLALIGDLVIASTDAVFIEAFRHIGLVPDGGASYMIPRDITRVRAMELFLLGDRLPAAKAEQWGLVNQCVAPDLLMIEAMDLCQRLASGPASQGLIRRLVWDSLDSGWETQLRREREAQRDASKTEDFVEGITAFLERRPAAFQGA